MTNPVQTHREDVTQLVNDAYTERAHLVAALSKLFPASLESDPDAPDWPVCLIDLPSGQVSWHISLADLHLFAHLHRNGGRKWDGHTTPEKYARLDSLPADEDVRRQPQQEAKHQKLRQDAAARRKNILER